MFTDALRSVWVEVNLSNLDHNVKEIYKKIGPDPEMLAVIKADAYGHGVRRVAEVLRENGVKTFAVSTMSEVVTLREAGAKEEIIILGLTPDMYADMLVRYDVTPAVCSYKNAKAISDVARIQGRKMFGMVAVDTGMGRIGYQWDDTEHAIEEIKKMEKLPNFKAKALFSHLSTADEFDKSYSELQERRMEYFRDAVKAAGIDIPFVTMANSAAIMDLPSTHYDAVRPGIILYGVYPSNEVDKSQLDLKPFMSVKANIIHLKTLKKGCAVSYGRKFICKRDSKIATINLGYADGFPRAYSGKGKVIVNGVVCPIAGNICMDQCMIDVTDVPNVKFGDEVIIMGSDGKNTITPEYIAESTGTINYEILCAFGQRLPKVYVR